MAAGTSDSTAVKVAVIGGITALLAAFIGVVPLFLDDDGGAGGDTTTPAPPTARDDRNGTTTTPAPQSTTAPPERTEPTPPSTTAPAVATDPPLQSTVPVVPVGWSRDRLEAALVRLTDLPGGFQEYPATRTDVTWADAACQAAEDALLVLEDAVAPAARAERLLVRPADSWEVYQQILALDDPSGWLEALAVADAACDGVRFTVGTGQTGLYTVDEYGYLPVGADAGRSGLATIAWDGGGTQTVAFYNLAEGGLASSVILRAFFPPATTPLFTDPDAFMNELTARLAG